MRLIRVFQDTDPLRIPYIAGPQGQALRVLNDVEVFIQGRKQTRGIKTSVAIKIQKVPRLDLLFELSGSRIVGDVFHINRGARIVILIANVDGNQIWISHILPVGKLVVGIESVEGGIGCIKAVRVEKISRYRVIKIELVGTTKDPAYYLGLSSCHTSFRRHLGSQVIGGNRHSSPFAATDSQEDNGHEGHH